MGFSLPRSFSSFISTMLWDFSVLGFQASEVLNFVGLTLNASKFWSRSGFAYFFILLEKYFRVISIEWFPFGLSTHVLHKKMASNYLLLFSPRPLFSFLEPSLPGHLSYMLTLVSTIHFRVTLLTWGNILLKSMETYFQQPFSLLIKTQNEFHLMLIYQKFWLYDSGKESCFFP